MLAEAIACPHVADQLSKPCASKLLHRHVPNIRRIGPHGCPLPGHSCPSRVHRRLCPGCRPVPASALSREQAGTHAGLVDPLAHAQFLPDAHVLRVSAHKSEGLRGSETPQSMLQLKSGSSPPRAGFWAVTSSCEGLLRERGGPPGYSPAALGPTSARVCVTAEPTYTPPSPQVRLRRRPLVGAGWAQYASTLEAGDKPDQR